MDPISNKKDFEDLTIKLRDLAYSYIEKYNPSRQQTKTFLLKKYLTKFQGSKSRKEVSEIIDKIVLSLEKSNYLNDALYSDSKARNLYRRGYSLNKITYSLKSKGLDTKFIKDSIEKITILPRAGYLGGYTKICPDEDVMSSGLISKKFLLTKKYAVKKL